MLFSLIVYFLFKSIFKEVSSAEHDSTDYNVKEFFIKSLLYLMLVLCLVAALALPMTLYLADPTTEKVLITASSLHVGIFGLWFFISGLVAIYQR